MSHANEAMKELLVWKGDIEVKRTYQNSVSQGNENDFFQLRFVSVQCHQMTGIVHFSFFLICTVFERKIATQPTQVVNWAMALPAPDKGGSSAQTLLS